MTTYERILERCDEHDISLKDVDRLLLNESAYEEFYERTEGTRLSPATYRTTDAPAVRETDGDEYFVYVDESGFEVEVVL